MPAGPAPRPCRRNRSSTRRWPAGSVVLFTENVAQASPTWMNREHPRVAVFFAYNHLAINFHRPLFAPEVLEAMTPSQQSFFREVWC
jgi:hypothetical protein